MSNKIMILYHKFKFSNKVGKKQNNTSFTFARPPSAICEIAALE